MKVGIEAINPYLCTVYVDTKKVAVKKGIHSDRFDRLLMQKKSVHFSWEDSVTCAVNAAKPIIDSLSQEERAQIDLVITSSESGVDLGRSISTFVHPFLKLERGCRLFEIKQACYGGTAALQMAAAYVRGSTKKSKALVICSDIAQKSPNPNFEVSQGSGAVAMLVSNNPVVLELEYGCNGLYSFDVADTFRPAPGIETGDPELSLMSYLSCIENSYLNYQAIVKESDFKTYFQYLSMHTPFGGMVKGAHRAVMRKLKKATPDEIEADFTERMGPSLQFVQDVGNLYSGSVYLAICGTIDGGRFGADPKRLGIFSYGSGCSSEFYSGLATQRSQEVLKARKIRQSLDSRIEIEPELYDQVMQQNQSTKLGTSDWVAKFNEIPEIFEAGFKNKGLLVLNRISDFKREYIWS